MITPSDHRRYRKEAILAAIDALILEAPNSKDIEGETERIILQAYPGQFTLFNSKGALRNAREHIGRSEARRAYESPNTRPPKIPNPKAHKAPKLGEFDLESCLKASAEFTADPKKNNRKELQQIYADGGTMVASDGKSMIELRGKFPGTKTKPVFFDPRNRKQIESRGVFPEIRFRGKIILTNVDSDYLFSSLHQSKAFLVGCDTNVNRSISLYKNLDGTVGIETIGEVQPNDIETMWTGNAHPCEFIGRFNTNLFLRIVNTIRALGQEKFDILLSDKARNNAFPLILTAPNIACTLMPLVTVSE